MNDSNGRLVVRPCGGLCNRMRTIGNAVALSQLTSRSLHIEWACNSELNCTFSRLFIDDSVTYSIKNTSTTKRQAHAWDLKAAVLSRFSRVYRNSRFSRTEAKQLGLGIVDAIKRSNAPTVLVQADVLAGDDALTDGLLPVPNVEIQSRAAACIVGGEMLVGVHVRGTDHVVANDVASVPDFAQAMEQVIALNDGVRFYLATDEPQARKSIEEKFGDRLIASPVRSLRRDSPEGVIDALCELLVLSSTKLILGTYRSSYSAMAARLGGNPLLVVENRTPISRQDLCSALDIKAINAC